MHIVRDGNDYEPQSVSRWRLRELLQHEKDNADLRRRIAALEAELDARRAVCDAPPPSDRELLDAAKDVLKQFDFIKRVQQKELCEGQTLESAAENWKGLGNEYIEFQPLIDAVEKAEQRRA